MLFSKISSPASLVVTFLGLSSPVSATTVHWNSGCGLVGGTAICASKDTVTVDSGTAFIYGCFPGSASDPTAYAACGAQFNWPSDYGDVYYGANNCLYDASGDSIDGECNIENEGGADVLNPYYVYYG